MGKSRKIIHQVVALLVIFTLAYAQTALLTHKNHATVEHTHDLPSIQSSAHVLNLKCGVCDYIFHNHSEPAFHLDSEYITVFQKDIDPVINRSLPDLLTQHVGQHLNRGPPLA